MGSRLTRGPGRRAPRSARPPGLAVLAGLCAGLAVIACVTLLVALLTGTTAGAAVPSYPGPSATAADGSGPLLLVAASDGSGR